MGQIYGIASTCSMRELGGIGSYDAPDTISPLCRPFRGVLCNVTTKQNSEKLIASGFRLVGTYMGNHGLQVFVHLKADTYPSPEPVVVTKTVYRYRAAKKKTIKKKAVKKKT